MKMGAVGLFVQNSFQQMDRSKSQELPDDIFFRPSVGKTQCIIGTGKNREFVSIAIMRLMKSLKPMEKLYLVSDI